MYKTSCFKQLLQQNNNSKTLGLVMTTTLSTTLTLHQLVLQNKQKQSGTLFLILYKTVGFLHFPSDNHEPGKVTKMTDGS